MEEKLTDKQKAEVQKILLLPIVCSKRYKSIEIQGDEIHSGQKFYTSPDEDMSDIAIAFYEILYANALNGKKILSGEDLADCCFAGDTMNSFNTISNMLKKKEISNEEEVLLEEYEKQYHCLANFWILPSCIGRRSRKGNNLDSMDIFLNSIDDDYDGVMKKHLSYYKAWSKVADFRRDHCLNGYVKRTTESVRKSYADKDGETIINEATDRIKQRAIDISESDKGKELWKYFHDKLKEGI
ncbi:MAG: hypothetical protein PHY47_21735 [Lachnospiraceae bacterium]|nr:hypothetical protein [Lachnospiraceae bacterium]